MSNLDNINVMKKLEYLKGAISPWSNKFFFCKSFFSSSSYFTLILLNNGMASFLNYPLDFSLFLISTTNHYHYPLELFEDAAIQFVLPWFESRCFIDDAKLNRNKYSNLLDAYIAYSGTNFNWLGFINAIFGNGLNNCYFIG